MLEVKPDAIKEYLKSIIKDYSMGISVEATHRPTYVNFINGLGDGLHAFNEAKQIECGSPDVPIYKGKLALGYVEFKDIGVNLDQAEKTDQVKGYLSSLHNLILSDYLEFRWFVKGNFIRSIRVASIDRNGKIIVDESQIPELAILLEEFLRQDARRITRSSDLSVIMAHIARGIRENLLKLFEKGQQSEMINDIRQTLSLIIPDIIEDDKTAEFIDMYAQTIIYGLFVARCNHTNPEPFNRANAAIDIPKTNPFVKALFENVMGTALLEEPYYYLIEDMVAILSNTDVEKVLGEFVRTEGQDNPVIYFYETFLTEYDKDTKVDRGVFYTPEPIVNYIIRSVDWVLKTSFNIEDGIADTRKIKYKTIERISKKNGKVTGRVKKLQFEDVSMEKECHKVLILDPTCGTGAFLYGTIRYIRYNFMENNDAGLWIGYVREHLIPRLFGFEILIAPYTIAHFNLTMELKGRDLTPEARSKWAYIEEDKRLNIFLTDTLKESGEDEEFWGPLFRYINSEIHQSGVVKKDLPVMVVMGNPPYNVYSTNEYDINAYKYVDGVPIDERNLRSLQDDYVKFIRWTQNRIERTGYGVVALITNHGYLDNVTFNGMRKSLIDSFDEIYVLDLHGNSIKKEKTPGGSKDENVFNIQQGVSIGIFVKKSSKHENTLVKHAEIWGLKNDKFDYLTTHSAGNTKWSDITPKSPDYMFKKSNTDSLRDEYYANLSIDEIFTEKSNGFQTSNDELVITFDKKTIAHIIKEIAELPIEEGRTKYGKPATNSGSGWIFENARSDIIKSETNPNNIAEALYRPYDYRYTYYTGRSNGIHERPRGKVMSNLFNKDNLALCIGRQGIAVNEPVWNLAFVTKRIVDLNLYRRGGSLVLPLYRYDNKRNDEQKDGEQSKDEQSDEKQKTLNINPKFTEELATKQKITEKGSDFVWEDIIYYIYAILYSPSYRKRYAEFLKYDYPRIPITADKGKFKALCNIGKKLIQLHLMEEVPSILKLSYPVAGDDIVGNAEHKEGRLFINDNQYFLGVPEDMFKFTLGGRPIIKNWLDARKGRKLEYADFEHLKKMLNAIAQTPDLQKEIDKIIGNLPIA